MNLTALIVMMERARERQELYRRALDGLLRRSPVNDDGDHVVNSTARHNMTSRGRSNTTITR